jgi:hypothetical protein
MALQDLDIEDDVATSSLETQTAYEITTLTGAQTKVVNAFVAESTSIGFLNNAQGSTTVNPLSSTFRHVANYFFSSTAGTTVPVAQDTNTTTSIFRAIQVARTTMDDGIVSGTVTAIAAFGTSGSNTFIDVPGTALTGSIGRVGTLVQQGATTNIGGSVFYDQGTIILHGGTGVTNFLDESSSGFTFGAASAGKVVITQLSFKTLTVTKRVSVFCRAKNKQFNYTNNPTAIADSVLGTISGNLTAQPTTFITTVGIYNDDGELLAVAKTSPPIRKRFDQEATLSVNIDY